MTSEDRIFDKLDELAEQMATLNSTWAGQQQICQLHRERVGAIQLTLYGNGKPGLVNEIEEIKREQRSANRVRQAIMAALGVLAGVVGTLLGVLAEKWL